ncbi:TonB-dependent receptor [Rubrivirga marina]|uniref:TonB-dependent receptor n=1 Tax=Rubrivirga marina TaxID=1196024 RepID=UPI0015C8AFD0|nr:TonB-dependent receptor [Rubrivirga marina]
MRIALLTALLAVSVPAAAGQVVRGRVTDTDTGAPVVGAAIRASERGSAAGADGAFLLTLPEAGEAALRITAVGYQPVEQTVAVAPGDTLRLDVALAPREIRTDRVVVTATRTAKALEDVAVPTTVVDAETIRRQGAVRLGDVLETVPGLQLFDDHGGGVQVQGFSSDYTLVLLDGEPVIGRTAGTLDVDRLTVAGVERVEVVAGPSSSLYGSEALAGVVNLVTALPAPGTEAGALRLRAGSYGQTDATAEAALGRDGWAARTFVNRFGSAGYDLTPDAFGPTVPAFTDWTADLRARANLGAARLSLGARLAAQDQSGAFAGLEDGAEVRYDDTASRLDWSVHPELALPLGERFRLTTTLYGARYATETRYRRQSDGRLFYSDDFDQRYSKAEAQLDALWSARHLTVVGAGAIDERLAGDRYGEDAAGAAPSAQQVYAFAQHEWALSRLLEVNASARFDAHSDYAARLTPKLSVLARPSDALRLRASVGSGFKAPAFRQLYLSFTNAAAGYSVFGSTRLEEGLRALDEQGQLAQVFLDPAALGAIEAESSVAFNVGAAVDLTPALRVEAGAFWNEVSDLIETQPVAQKTNGQSVFGYFNLDRVYTRGLDAQVTARPLGGVEVVGSYQFLQARDRDLVEALETGTVFGRDLDGRDTRLTVGDYGGLFGRSPHAAMLRATLTRGSASASLRGRWRSRYGYRDLDGNGLANRDDEFVPGYAVLDLTLTKSWATPAGRLQAQAGAENLLDVTRSTLVPSLPGRTLFASLGLSL